MNTLRSYHWIAFLILAFTAHGSSAYIAFYAPKPTEGAKALGVGGYEVSISMVAATVGAQPEEEVLEIPEPEPEPEQEPEQKTEPDPDPMVDPELEPVIEEMVKPIPTPVKAPKIKPNPVIEPPKKKITKKAPQPKKTVKKQPPREKVLAKKSQGRVQMAHDAQQSDQATSLGGGRYVGEVKPNYITTLRRWLEKHKTYPHSAKRRRQQGVVVLAFTVMRSGEIPEFRLKKGSGFKALDLATLDMLKRAQPLPPFPEDMEGDLLKIALPIQFALR